MIEPLPPGTLSLFGTVFAIAWGSFILPSLDVGALVDPAASCAAYRDAEADQHAAFLDMMRDQGQPSESTTPGDLGACVTRLVAECEDSQPIRPIVEQCLSTTNTISGEAR